MSEPTPSGADLIRALHEAADMAVNFREDRRLIHGWLGDLAKILRSIEQAGGIEACLASPAPAPVATSVESDRESLIRRIDSAWCLALVNAHYPDGWDRNRAAQAVTEEYNRQRDAKPSTPAPAAPGVANPPAPAVARPNGRRWLIFFQDPDCAPILFTGHGAGARRW